MTLHIIKSASADVLARLPEIISDQDHVLLVEDACYLHTLAKKKLAEGVTISALMDHVKSRGLESKSKEIGIKLISFKEWALLTREHSQSVTW